MRIDDGRALPNFLRQALKNEEVTVYGDGSQTRSFCYVNDLIAGIFKLLMSDEPMPVNIGNPDEVSLRTFAEEVIALSASKSKMIFADLPKDDPKVRKPDITRARTILSWEPAVSRAEGLALTMDYFKRELGITSS